MISVNFLIYKITFLVHIISMSHIIDKEEINNFLRIIKAFLSLELHILH